MPLENETLKSPDRAEEFSGVLSQGLVLEGRYEIVKVVGRGGMGAVYLARDTRFEGTSRLCAVKEMINPIRDPVTRKIATSNFEREANLLASLSHPAIPKVYDYFSQSQRSYLVLEYVEGKDLGTIMTEKACAIPEVQVIPWALQICDVLTYLHNHQPKPIVFRDLKPSNVMVKDDGRIMLIDFGIAKVFEEGQKGTMIGTEGYAPPEQYRGEAQPAGDIYALGATMHHLLTGQDPRNEPPFTFHERPVRTLNPAVSKRVEMVVMKALAYEPKDRYSQAEQMKKDLLATFGRDEGYVVSLLTGVAPAGEKQPLWTFTCEDEVRSSPAISGKALFIGSYDRNLYALDAKTGALFWKYTTEGGIPTSPCVGEDLVFFGSEDGVLYAVSARTGRIEWTCPTKDRIRSSPRLEYEYLFFGSDDGNLYAVKAKTGRILWRFSAEGPIRSSPAFSEGKVYFGAETGCVYALDAPSGQQAWRYQTQKRATSSPTVEGRLVLVGSADGYLYALDQVSGWAVWRYHTGGPVISSPHVAKGLVYVGSSDRRLHALDAETGRLRWAYETDGAVTSSPRVADGAVYFGSVDGCIYSLDTQSGALRWRFQTGGPIPGSPAIAEGTVYIGSTDRRIYALPAGQ